jgi:energy-coupling factor transporter ATP-binding protein EcfA2
MEGYIQQQISPQDVKWTHPFTCIATGPSGSGKTTFVKDLLLHQSELISQKFDKIYVFIGTELKNNPLFEDLQMQLNNVNIVELPVLYPSGLKGSSFKEDFTKIMNENVNNNVASCVIFDDLMTELAEIQLLEEMFTKWSSHGNMSVIHITQNIFHKGKGSSSAAATLYRNSKVIVLFQSPMDYTTLNIIVTRLAKGGKKRRTKLLAMLNDILDQYRYVVIRGNLQTPSQLKYTTDLFATEPVRHIKVFSLLHQK